MSNITKAVIKNDISAIKSLLNGGNIDKPDEEGYTPLYVASMKKEVKDETVAEILKLGAQVDAKGTDQETPLYIAVFNNRASIVDLLVKKGADVNATNGRFKETALHCAARLGLCDLVSYLLSHKAEINARNTKQETPLFSAAKMGRHETACLLLEKGANATLSDEDGKTPLYIASEKGYKHVVIVLQAEPKDLRHAKAEADAELRRLPTPMPTSSELIDRAENDKAFKEQIRRGSLPVVVPETKPMEVVQIHVPEAKKNTHDPFTGASKGPCRSLEEVGYDEPPAIPKELQNRPPAKLQRIGGTSMVVTTEDGEVKPAIRVDELQGEPEMEFYVPKK